MAKKPIELTKPVESTEEKNPIEALLNEASAITRKPFELSALPAKTEPVQIVLIGQPQQNLFGMLNKIFGGLDDLEGMMFRGLFSYDTLVTRKVRLNN